MILDKLAQSASRRVNKDKEKTSYDEMKQSALNIASKDQGFAFENALRQSDIGFICEVKAASLSRGIISFDFPYMQIAKEYEEGGAACISVLTEPVFYLGSDEYLHEIRKEVKVPLLRKDFIIDDYQLYQSKVLGADAVPLICSLLTEGRLCEYLKICDELRISALVEVRSANEVNMAVGMGARAVLANNLNYDTFEVDIGFSVRLRPLVPDGVLYVADSGIRTAGDVELLRNAKVDGVIIGEALIMAEDNIKEKLRELREGRWVPIEYYL